MQRRLKIGISLAVPVVLIPGLAMVALFLAIWSGAWSFPRLPSAPREIRLPNQGSLFIEAASRRGRSEHGFSESAGYREAGSSAIEWFGDLSDGVEPQVYVSGAQVVVIDCPAAQLFVRRPADGISEAKWYSLALVFPDDLGPALPISFYAERNGLSEEEVRRIHDLSGPNGKYYPTASIESFDPKTRDLRVSYHLDNARSWPLHLRLSQDGARLALVEIGRRDGDCSFERGALK